jgi:hypothetical protein
VAEGRTGARVVVWEMPVRVLAMDLGGQTPGKGH